MDVYIMKTGTSLIDFIQEAVSTQQKTFLLRRYLFRILTALYIQGYEYKGYVGCITSVEAYYNINMDYIETRCSERTVFW